MKYLEYRGKSLNGSEWVYGSLIVYWKPETTPDIYDPERSMFIAVDRDTVGQFTGVLDKKGRKIYGGMKVAWKVGSLRVEGIVNYSEDYGVWMKGNGQNLGSYQKSTEIIE